ncbi:unnamed protein product [Moneuplotes crassus]|uniref:Proteasome adapter and scaffold protein ECM29 HEAT-repeat domain-containing protein n=1 Tax=Euplotes crassus TaxID=5936 RepID=A0AAD1Y0I2_EUPCR|nr:unnamed protein product [Moneuplotes crassus]
MDQQQDTQKTITSLDELKRLELRFMMAEDAKIEQVLQVIFQDILSKFFEQDILEVFSLGATEKIKTLVSICNHINDRVETSQESLKIPIYPILEFITHPDFSNNIHLNKIIQLYLQETLYSFLIKSLQQEPSLKRSCIGMLFKSCMVENITPQFQYKLFFLFIHCMPSLSKEPIDELRKQGFPGILAQNIPKFKEMSNHVLYYYNYISQTKDNMKEKVTKFTQQIISKDRDPCLVKFGGTKMSVNDSLKYLQTNLLQFISLGFTIKEEVEEEKEDQKDDQKRYPEYSYHIIPSLMISTASVINEVNEKAKIILKGFEKHSDIDQSSAEIKSIHSQSDEESVKMATNSGLNAVSVWSDIMKYYLDMTRNSMAQSLARFDEQTKKTIILFSRNLKRNVLEYALKCEVTAKLPQLLTAINDPGQIRHLGLKFIDHMIKHLFTYMSEEISITNAKTIYGLLSKIIARAGFLNEDERSLAYQSLVEVVLKYPKLLELGKKDPLELMDETFNEFQISSDNKSSQNEEVYANWIKSLGRLKFLFENNSQKGFAIVKITERIENIINNHGIDDDYYSMNIFICVDWISFLSTDQEVPFNLLYICIILSNANDLKIKDASSRILQPILNTIEKELKIFSIKNELQESKIEHEEEKVDTYQRSLFVKKSSQYPINSLKAYNISRQLCVESLKIFKLLKSSEEQDSLQPHLESHFLKLFAQENQSYTQNLGASLNILLDYVRFKHSSIQGDSKIFSDIGNYFFLVNILRNTTIREERKTTFDILEILLSTGDYEELKETLLGALEDFGYKDTIDFGVEQHSAICNLTVLLLKHSLDNKLTGSKTYQDCLDIFFKLCNDFNQISDYKYTNLDKIHNFGYCISRLAEKYDLRILGNDNSEYFDDLLAKLIEIVDNKDLEIEFRKTCIDEYLKMLHKNTDLYIDHLAYLREQYIEYDQYELHRSIGASASYLLNKEDLEKYFTEVIGTINSKDSTLIAKRASIVHLAEFIIGSPLLKHCQEELTNFQNIFFKYMFDKKELIQELASNVLTKLYHIGDAETKKKLVQNLSKALGGSQTLTHMQEKEEDFELNLEYKPSTEESKKMKTFKDLCDIAADVGHRELVYQFLNIHRNLTQYKNIRKAAESLHGILLEDEQVRKDLLKMVPKLFLMTYDYNEEIRDTMKEVMSVLVTGKEEKQIILDNFDDVVKELFDAIKNKKEFRKRLAALYALSDVISWQEWAKIKTIFSQLYELSFKGIDDPNDNVKKAAFELMKTLKKIILRNGNIYTCTNTTELKEIYAIVLPMLLEKGILSHIDIVKYYSVVLLYEILETSKEESVIDKLKVRGSREDRQLNYTYNSKQKMREIMAPYLKNIVTLITECISDFETREWNKLENEVVDQKGANSDQVQYLNDMRIKSSKESILYDTLSICKELMSEEVLDDTIPDLIKIIKKGVGLSTRACACNFIIEISIERPELFKLKFAKKVFKSCIDILANAKSCKESLLKIVCRLGGSLFRVMSKSFKTIQDSLDDINSKLLSKVDKYDEMIGFGLEKYWIAYLLIIREAIKNLKDLELTQEKGAIIQQVIPYVFAIKNNTLEDESKREQIKKLGNGIFKDIFENRISIPVEAFEDDILGHIKALLDSSNFMIRANGSAALADLCEHTDDNSLLQKLKDKKIIDLLINKNIGSNYFTDYLGHIRKIISFGVGGITGKYVRANSLLLEKVSKKLVTKLSNQLSKSDLDMKYKKEAALLMSTVGNIIFRLLSLDYDTEEDKKPIRETSKNYFNNLFTLLQGNYESEEAKEEEKEEVKIDSHVKQPDIKNKDIRSVNKQALEFHQLIVEALAYSHDQEQIHQQFELYQKLYFSVSREMRLGILNNLQVLFEIVCNSKTVVRELVEENKTLKIFLLSIVGSTQENLLQLSKILRILVESLSQESEVRVKILENIDEIFASKVKEDKRNKKREQMREEQEVDDSGAIKIASSQHDKLKEENKVLTMIMQNYYLMKNSQ